MSLVLVGLGFIDECRILGLLLFLWVNVLFGWVGSGLLLCFMLPLEVGFDCCLVLFDVCWCSPLVVVIVIGVR